MGVVLNVHNKIILEWYRATFFIQNWNILRTLWRLCSKFNIANVSSQKRFRETQSIFLHSPLTNGTRNCLFILVHFSFSRPSKLTKKLIKKVVKEIIKRSLIRVPAINSIAAETLRTNRLHSKHQVHWNLLAYEKAMWRLWLCRSSNSTFD